MGLLKSLLALWVLEETRQTWPMFSELKALIDSGRFQVIVFQYRAKNDNSEFSLPSMIPRVTKKFRVIVIMYRDKNDNSELGIHLRTNSEIFEVSENSQVIAMAICKTQRIEHELVHGFSNNSLPCKQMTTSYLLFLVSTPWTAEKGGGGGMPPTF